MDVSGRFTSLSHWGAFTAIVTDDRVTACEPFPFGAALDERVREGVLVMATGAWYSPDASGLEIAGNPNVLSRDVGTSRLTQGPSPLSVLVEVEPYRGAAPVPASRARPEIGGEQGIL